MQESNWRRTRGINKRPRGVIDCRLSVTTDRNGRSGGMSQGAKRKGTCSRPIRRGTRPPTLAAMRRGAPRRELPGGGPDWPKRWGAWWSADNGQHDDLIRRLSAVIWISIWIIRQSTRIGTGTLPELRCSFSRPDVEMPRPSVMGRA